jgi:hypothetical protein
MRLPHRLQHVKHSSLHFDMSQGNDEITEDVKITTLWGDFPKESK